MILQFYEEGMGFVRGKRGRERKPLKIYNYLFFFALGIYGLQFLPLLLKNKNTRNLRTMYHGTTTPAQVWPNPESEFSGSIYWKLPIQKRASQHFIILYLEALYYIIEDKIRLL